MRKTILFIAMSLDGYIADINGDVKWLGGENNDNNDMQSYEQFIKGIDTVIMGWKTYYQIYTELFTDQWPYKSMMSYVITHQSIENRENIHFVQDNLVDFITRLKKEEGKDIWICGGAQIVNQCLENSLIDRIHISVIPTILGNGVRLFQTQPNEIKLKLIDTLSYNGITDLIYELR